MSDLTLSELTLGQYGSLASIAGVAISIVGFAVTIFNVMKSKSSADAAKKAATRALDVISAIDAISEVSTAIERLESAKEKIRQGLGLHQAEMYSRVKRRLISAKSSREDLSDSSKDALRTSITMLSLLEKHIDECVQEKTDVGIKKTNRALSNIIEGLQSLLAELQSEGIDNVQ